MAFSAWKHVDDAIRAAEKDARSIAGADGGSDYAPDDGAESSFQHHEAYSTEDLVRSAAPPAGYSGGGLMVGSPAVDGRSWRSPSEYDYGESKERLEDRAR